jgi:predicted acylesterase/phospholipase RssA
MSGAPCPQTPPVNREAVIAIQGGGIYVLPMLGQARAIFSAGYVPLGFAGNSGGAILAALLWAGLTPDRIEAAFTEMLRNDKQALTALLLPRETGKQAFRLTDLRAFPGQIQGLLPPPDSFFGAIRWFLCFGRAARRLGRSATELWRDRGAFSGERFVDLIDSLIKEGLGIRQTSLARFGDVPKNRYRPPLLLTVTNVSRGRLDIIDSTDPLYQEVPVALAVRASGGFPAFFQPIDLPGVADGRCFVDGGMVANFPLWAFSASFRERLQGTSAFGWLAPRPWLPIGLRVRDRASDIDVSTPEAYAGRLALIAAGMARNDLEDRLVAATLSNQLVVAQESISLPPNPRTGQPLDVLDIDAVTADNIAAIIQSGETAALNMLRACGDRAIYDPGCGPDVLEFLEDLLVRCEHAMHTQSAALGFRANIFVAVRRRMEMRFSVRMHGSVDDGLCFPDLATGLTGWCYQTRSPAVCNLQSVSQIAGAGGGVAQRPYGLGSGLQQTIEPNRTWLISYPIFDPAERQPLQNAPKGLPGIYAPTVHRLKADQIGPILGILNVDAAWDYTAIGLSSTPDLHVHDTRIKVVIDAIAQASLRLARILVRRTPLETMHDQHH